MKRYFKKIIALCFLAIFCVPLIVSAQQNQKTVVIENPMGEGSTLWSIFDKIVNFLFMLSLPVAALMIVIAAFFFLTSAGDPQKVTQAKHLIIWALVGVVVLFLAKAIIALLLGAIGVENPFNGSSGGNEMDELRSIEEHTP